MLPELICADRIDILVDLTLHMADNRLMVFARKPAQLQVTFTGYPGTTGLDAIDYRLTDPYLDPPGAGNHLYAEKSIRLPDTFWRYDPAVMTTGVGPEPAVGPGAGNRQRVRHVWLSEQFLQGEPAGDCIVGTRYSSRGKIQAHSDGMAGRSSAAHDGTVLKPRRRSRSH